MNAGAVLIGFLDTLLYCAVIILVAYAILWVLNWIGVSIEGNVLKWGKIVVGLLCIIAVVSWLLSIAGIGGLYTPHLLVR